VGWGQLDLRFRDGSDVASPVTPGEPLEVSFDLQPLDAVIPAGSYLYVTISGGTGWNRLPNLPNYPMELAVGDGTGSLRFASPKPPPGSFFEPKTPDS
jgi:predicted acyl esterase